MVKFKHIFEKHEDFFQEQQEEIGRLLRSTMKFYWHNDKAFPSVTSILRPKGLSHFAAEYASRGSIVHYVFKCYLEIGKWIDWRDCEFLEKDIYVVETGRSRLRIEDANIKGFLETYGDRFDFDRSLVEKRFFNEEYSYTGKPDVPGLYAGWPAVIDVKTIGTYDKKAIEMIFMQLAAYAHGIGNPEAWGVCIPLNGKTKEGFGEPIVCTDLQPYWEKFLARRKALLDLYGI